MRILSERERRLVAIGVLVGGLALVDGLVVAPIASGFAERAARRADILAQTAHAEQTIAALPRLRRLARQEAGQTHAFVMRAASADAGGLVVEERLRAGIEAAGGAFRGAEHDTTTRERIRVRAVAHMPIDKLSRWLERLENEQPYLVVEQLAISADAALASQKAEDLDVKIEVSLPFTRAAS